MQTTSNSFGAIDIGLMCLGCIDEQGQTLCPSLLNGKCSANRATSCMVRAISQNAEAQAEIVIATISVLSRRAKTPADLLKQLPALDRSLEAVLAA